MKNGHPQVSPKAAASISTSQRSTKSGSARRGAYSCSPPIHAETACDFVRWTREPSTSVPRVGQLVEMRRIPIPHEGFEIVIEIREDKATTRVYLNGPVIGAIEWCLVRPQLWQMMKRYRKDPRPLSMC